MLKTCNKCKIKKSTNECSSCHVEADKLLTNTPPFKIAKATS